VLKAIVTDVDGTMYLQAPVRRWMAFMLMKYCAAHPVDGWKTMKTLRAYRKAQEALRSEATPGMAHLQITRSATAIGYPEAFVSDRVHQWMNVAPLPAVRKARAEGLASFCQWATSRGIQMGALSDYDPRQKLLALEVSHYFSVSVWAQETEVGTFKPDPKGLRIALRRLGVQPGEAIYVGDRLEVDGATAVACGVPGVLITSRSVECPPGVHAVQDWNQLRQLIDSKFPPP
jgi:HAD superfamily hydrolase (TIGR01549 family)